MLVSPTIQSIGPRGIARRQADQKALFDAIAALAPADAPIEWDEFALALKRAFDAQREFDDMLVRATGSALEWIAADESRHGAVVVGRPYHSDPALLHRIDQELNRLGFAVVPAAGLASADGARTSAPPLWKPSKHLVSIVEAAARRPRLEVVALRAFGCGYDAVAFDEAREVAMRLNRPFTELKVDDIADTAHIRIRLRTLAETVGVGGARTAGNAPSACRGSITPDLCSTAKELVHRVAKEVDGFEPPYTVDIPFVCQDCLVDALPFQLQRMNGYAPEVRVEKSAPSPAYGGLETRVASENDGVPVIGLVGNPFLVFDERMNEGVKDLIERLGCVVVLPNAHLLEVEDVRYLPQLDAFYKAGVNHVVYLQSFGCLKGHVQSRGAQHEFARRYPDMPVTIIDYDSESSALNRENRIRLAVEAAKLAKGRCGFNMVT